MTAILLALLGHAARRTDDPQQESKTVTCVAAGHRFVSPAMDWWPGAGSNRRPSAFQADARTN
jgi:hypothetical protein